MKAGFTFDSDISNKSKFFIISNYHPFNLIHIYGFDDFEEMKDNRGFYDIGVWQPKGTKASNEYMPTRIYLSPINPEV